MFSELAARNAAALQQNAYPGRGIVIGMTADGTKMVQVYFIMGRSENSRNRIFLEENGFVRTKAFDESKLTDPSLIIYYPVRFFGGIHIVSNGDQTDTVFDGMQQGKTFEETLRTREFEPDAPNYTPRITGMTSLIAGDPAYRLSILKSQNMQPDACVRAFYTYEKAIPGYGHMIHTYQQDGNPLPSFNQEPYLMPIPNDMQETCDLYWSMLDEDNRISLLVKQIDIATGKSEIFMINRHLMA